MTESTTWLSIAADDLQQIRARIDAGQMKWSDDEVFLRLLWDLGAGIVGLAQEMHSEHRETVKIWKQRDGVSRMPAHGDEHSRSAPGDAGETVRTVVGADAERVV